MQINDKEFFELQINKCTYIVITKHFNFIVVQIN